MKAAAAAARSSCARSEASTGFEFVVTIVDLRAGECPEPVHTELLTAETAHHRPVDHGAAQFHDIDPVVLGVDSAARQISDEAAGKAVARAGGVEDFLQEVARRDEVAVAAK